MSAEPTLPTTSEEPTGKHAAPPREGDPAAARSYNTAATAYTRDHRPGTGGATTDAIAQSNEGRQERARASMPLGTTPPPAAAPAEVTIHFVGTAWLVEDSSLANPLVFTHLADAEQRATELARSVGRPLRVIGQDEAPPAPSEPPAR